MPRWKYLLYAIGVVVVTTLMNIGFAGDRGGSRSWGPTSGWRSGSSGWSAGGFHK